MSDNAKNNSMIYIAVAGVLAVIGIVCWIVMLVSGPTVLCDTIPWGIFIATFFLLAGAGAGLVLLTALGDFGIIPGLAAFRRSMLAGAVGCLAAAGFVIIMDLGNPANIFGFLTSANFSSLFVWDFYFLLLTLVLALVAFFMKDANKVVICLAALVALGLVMVEGWILAVSPVEAWGGALIPVVFLIEAFLVAFSLVIIVKSDRPKCLGGIAAGLLGLLLIITILEAVAGGYMGGSAGGAATALLVGGGLAGLYWTQIIAGIVIPIVLLAGLVKNEMAIKAGAVLAICGVLMAKVALLVAGQTFLADGSTLSYFPTIVEWGGVIGGIGIAAFVFLLGKKLFIKA